MAQAALLSINQSIIYLFI